MVLSWIGQGKIFIDTKDLPDPFLVNPKLDSAYISENQILQMKQLGMKDYISKIRDEAIIHVYHETKGNIRKTASRLQVNSSQVYKALGLKDKTHERSNEFTA